MVSSTKSKSLATFQTLAACTQSTKRGCGPHQERKMTVYAYIRVSTTEQVDNTSMQEQRRQCKGNAMAHGHSIDRFVEDGGVSGAEPFMERLERHGVTPKQGRRVYRGQAGPVQPRRARRVERNPRAEGHWAPG
jgi:hypothetical protein